MITWAIVYLLVNLKSFPSSVAMLLLWPAMACDAAIMLWISAIFRKDIK